MRSLIALVVLVLAGISDHVDGYLARRWDQVTRLGQLLDPAADRLYVTVALLVPLVRQLSAVAPQVRIEIVTPDEHADAMLDRGLVDIIITPAEFIESDHPTELLFEEEHVVACCASNPIMKRGRVSEPDFMRAGHVGVTMGNTRTLTFGDRQLETMGKRRNIEIVASSFTAVPWLLIGTARLAVMHARLAHAMKGHFEMAYGPLPFDFPVMREMLQIHRARTGDGGLGWLRNQLKAAALQNPIHKINRRT